MILEARAVSVRYPGLGAPALDGVSCGAAPSRLLAVVGPNGSGKTTLVRALAGLVAPESGAVLLNTLGPFIDIGYGQSSAFGTPVLALSGTPASGGTVSGSVMVIASSVPGFLIVGHAPGYVSFHGGVLVPTPDAALPILAGPTFAAAWPPGIPGGTAFYAQAVLLPGAGETLNSNAVVILAERYARALAVDFGRAGYQNRPAEAVGQVEHDLGSVDRRADRADGLVGDKLHAHGRRHTRDHLERHARGGARQHLLGGVRVEPGVPGHRTHDPLAAARGLHDKMCRIPHSGCTNGC